MALNMNYRVLMCLLGLVILLNIFQIIFSVKRPKANQDIPTLFEISEAHMDAIENLKEFNDIWPPVKRILNSTATTALGDRDNATCPNTDITEEDESGMNLCPQIPPGLGPEPPVSLAREWLSGLINGGLYRNRKCITQQSIAVIVPYSGPRKNLVYFLSHLHPFMMKQQADYQIFVVDYENKSHPLPRGQLFNVGFMEAQKHRQWQCLVFHEPHLVPMDSRNLYRCDWYPKQLVFEIANMLTNENKTYQPTIGGALALTPEQFSKVNGFSNRVTGRNGDYFDFYKRLQWANYTLERSEPLIGKYKTLAEPIAIAVNESFYSSTVSPFHLIDGLSTLTYSVGQVDYQLMYTYIGVGTSEDFEQKSNSKMLDVLLSHVLHTSQVSTVKQ